MCSLISDEVSDCVLFNLPDEGHIMFNILFIMYVI